MKVNSLIKFSFKKNGSFKDYLNSLEYTNEDNIDSILDFYVKNNERIISEKHRRVLIKGEVQSGKTNNIIYLINKLANKNDYFIYLSGHLNELNIQNKDRIKNSLTYMEHNFIDVNMNTGSFDENQIKRFKEEDVNTKLIFFGIKRKEYLENIFNSIRSFDSKANIIIFDDESDSHTISNSQIKLRNELLKFDNIKAYISITATPYLNLYKYQDDYEAFYIYKSHDKYTGINEFIDSYKVSDSHEDITILFNLILYVAKNNNGQIIWNQNREKKEHLNAFSQIKYDIKSLMSDKSRVRVRGIESRGIEYEDYKNILNTLFKNTSISNSKYKPIFNETSILIGRENMSRGITYENLISEYIYINSKKYNPAAIMQASRWFGSRNLSKMFIIMNQRLISAYEECVKLEKMTDQFKLTSSFKDEYDNQHFEYLKKLDKL